MFTIVKIGLIIKILLLFLSGMLSPILLSPLLEGGTYFPPGPEPCPPTDELDAPPAAAAVEAGPPGPDLSLASSSLSPPVRVSLRGPSVSLYGQLVVQ